MAKGTKLSNQSRPVQVTRQQQVTTARSGPIPDPDDMARYEKIHPGFADRIMAMAEENGKNRREIEKINAQADADNAKNIIENDKISINSFTVGRWLGSFISLVAIGGAIYLGVTGGSIVVATALVAFPVASIIQSIISPSKKDKNKNKDKED